MICPKCKRDFVRGDVVSEIVHRPIGKEGMEAKWLCGYTSQSFLELDALPSTILSSTIRRLWKALDEHIKAEGVTVEIRTDHGWVDLEDAIDDGLKDG